MSRIRSIGDRVAATILFRSLYFLALSLSISWLIFSVAGCNKSSNGIHGHISYQGAPISKGTVTFFPASGRAIPATISQGDYAAALPPGDYTAVIDIAPEYPAGFKEGDPLPPAKMLPEQYTARTKSTLKATVTAGQNQAIDFDLK